MSAKVIVLADRRPAPRPEPPVNPWAEILAWQLAWTAELLHAMAAALRPRR